MSWELRAAFTSAGMDGSSDWRFKTHLANLPIYYEYTEQTASMIQMLLKEHTLITTRMYLIFTSQILPVIGAELSAKTADDSRNEFRKR